MAVRVDSWKMHLGVKMNGSWFNEKAYPSVPYIFNLRMDPMEKMDRGIGRMGFYRAQVRWPEIVGAASGNPLFIAEHLKSLQAHPLSQAADTLSIHKALEKRDGQAGPRLTARITDLQSSGRPAIGRPAFAYPSCEREASSTI